MKQFWVFCLFFFFNYRIYSDSFIWKVESEGSYLYIGGTVHILRKSDYPLPAEFDTAFNDSDVLVLEVDPGDLSPEETAGYIRTHGSYTDGRSLKTILSPEAYKAFRDYCRANEISVMGLGKLKPAILMTTLMAYKFQKIDIARGVDFYYFEKNKKAGKKLKSLESHEFQLNMIVSMGEGYESEFVLKTIRDLNMLEEKLENMIDSWRTGDVDRLYEYEVKTMEDEDPGLYNELLLKRNNNWLSQIDEYLKSGEKELILVGGAHLVGPRGLLEQLQKKGYKISKVKIDEKK